NMNTESFKVAYAELNKEQKRAIDTIDGPVMVIAGPGTGKTQILTLRIANILLQTDTKPENILALTFTESGALAMRDRLRRYIGADAYRVPIHTFHGFAEKLIRDYPDAYTRVIGGRPAKELEKLSIIETIVDNGEVKLLRPSGNPAYYVVPILRIISKLKQEYIDPDQFATIIATQEEELRKTERIHEKGAHKGKVRGDYSKKEKNITKNSELLLIYRQYEALLRDRSLYDFDDMIVETVTALRENEDMRFDLQEEYQYIHADEHQDVNGSQNAILEQLASYHERPNIFVVGDEKQAIYRFQGASLENFLYFENVFPHTSTIALQNNYRSGQTILDAAHSLITSDAGVASALRVPLFAKTVTTSSVLKREFSHQAVEDEWLAESVQTAIVEGVKPEEVAIIVRTNREVEHYAALLRKKGISVRASADGDILSHPVMNSVRSLLNATVRSDDESALFELLHGSYWGIDTADLVRVMRARSYADPLSAIISQPAKLKSLGLTDTEQIHKVWLVLEGARKKLETEAPHHVLAYLLEESGFLDHILKQDPLESGRVVRRLYDEVQSMVIQDQTCTLASIGNVFAKLREYNIPLTAPYITTDTQAVAVMTAHKSKGLEFDMVYIPHLTDNVWGKGMSRTYFDVPFTHHVTSESLDEADDERRLLYVAMTRARISLSLSCAFTNAEGKDLTPSRMFEQIDSSFITEVSTEKEERAFDPAATLTKMNNEKKIEPKIFTDILRDRGLSATSLNNYLRDPWDYIYRNALRIPEIQPEHMLFGTALHNVMERITAQYTANGTIASDTEIKRLLEVALGRLPLTKESFVRRHEQGLLALITYVAEKSPTFATSTIEEFTLRVVLETGLPDFPEVVLTGKLDRLDLDEEGNVIRVVDYKTGKPKSRNVIEGNTKDADGAYKRQLVFYALLLSLYRADTDNEKYNCKEYALSFLEPDAKGKIREEVFTISDEEVTELKKVIINVVKEIISGNLIIQPCDESKSKYCHLAKQLVSENL
ncbi:MAG: ATP-dependent DNA helicase, partial [Candidatus Paceibacterota bacterium]